MTDAHPNEMIRRGQFTLRLALGVALLALLGAAVVVPGAARADSRAEVSIMDDQLLLGASKAKIDRQMRTFVRLGVDRLRVSAFWNQIAPATASRRKPRRFDAADHLDPRYSFAALDRVVSSASAHDLKLMISITTPAPIWATGRTRKPNSLWKPRAGEFADFAEAVSTRYARFVDHWAIANEPNQPDWLQPQSDRRGLVAPHLYRSIVLRAYPRIDRADPDSLILIGELAGSGRDGRGAQRPIRPLRFLRAMACRDRRMRRIRSGRCRNFKPIPADALGHHPYQFFFPPTRPSINRDDATVSDSARLLRLLDGLTRRGALRTGGRRLNVHYTEFGYQTKPPDPFSGVSLGTQRRWLQDAAFVAWRSPRVREINQFRLSDGPVRGVGPSSFREFQSGLLFRGGREKPAFRVFPNPFVIAGSRFWGQARPGGRHAIRVQYRRRPSAPFRLVAQVRTNARGYFSFRLPGRRRGEYRYEFSGGGADGRSHVVRVRS